VAVCKGNCHLPESRDSGSRKQVLVSHVDLSGCIRRSVLVLFGNCCHVDWRGKFNCHVAMCFVDYNLQLHDDAYIFFLFLQTVIGYYSKDYFNSLLFQKTSFFDDENNSVGTLTARLSGDVKQLEELLGMNIAMVLQS
jgi:hypothetical protein